MKHSISRPGVPGLKVLCPRHTLLQNFFLLFGFILILPSGLNAEPMTCPEPTYAGGITIDGNTGDWNLGSDFFADMYRAGKTDKPVESKLYLRYDCSNQKLYAMVLTVAGVTALMQPDDAFIKLGNSNKLIDGSASSGFAWVYDANQVLVGFEACVNLAQGSYTNLNVHLQVDNGGSQTSAVADRAIMICLACGSCNLSVAIDGPSQVCDDEMEPITFSADPSGSVTTTMWQISGMAEIQSGTDKSQEVKVVNVTGPFTLDLLVMDGNGCSASSSLEVGQCTIIVDCPESDGLACEDASAFSDWLEDFSWSSDGCMKVTVEFQGFYSDGSRTALTDDIEDIDPPMLCGGSVRVVMTVSSGTCSKQCEATFTYQDLDKPTIKCPGDITIACLDDLPDCDPSLADAKDNCGIDRISCSDSELSGSPCDGYITRTFTAYDLCGNEAACTQTIYIKTPMPTWSNPPGDLYLSCNEYPQPSSLAWSVGTGACMDGGSVTSELIGTVECQGYVTERWTYTDACNRSIMHSRKIHYQIDEEAPVASALAREITLACGAAMPAVPAVNFVDNCDQTLKIQQYQKRKGALCGGETYERVWIAEDDCGNSTKVTQTIRFIDEEAPMLTVPSDLTLECGDPIPEPTYQAYDNCSSVKVHFKERKEILNDCEYKLVRTWTARDGCGNETIREQHITVLDRTGPVITPVNPMISHMSMGSSMDSYSCEPPTMSLEDVNIDDCCGIASMEASDELVASGTCDQLGFYRKWKCLVTAVDLLGNESAYYFYVLQYDTTAPVIENVPEDLVLDCDQSIPSASVEVTVSDDCMLYEQPYFRERMHISTGNPDQQVVVRQWYRQDGCGNLGTGTQIITRCGADPSMLSGYIGDRVWYDVNGDGLQDADEPGVNDVNVKLYEIVGDQIGDTMLIDSTTTHQQHGEPGFYRFDYLPAGEYQIEFQAREGTFFTKNGDGTDPSGDSDVDTSGRTMSISLGSRDTLTDIDAGITFEPWIDVQPDPALSLSTGQIDEWQVFPNPTTNILHVSINNHQMPQSSSWKMTDLWGRMVQSGEVQLGQSRSNLDISSLRPGTYILHLDDGIKTTIKRVIKL